VNLTDGLDGLAIMPTVMIASALAVFAYVSGNAVFATVPRLSAHLRRGASSRWSAARWRARGLAFLWFNAYPAEVFMGDVGALALGAALGMIALVVRHEIVLLIMGGVFVVETLSVIIQVASFKLTGKARLPHGAAAPPLRIEGLERESGRRSLLDHHDDAWSSSACPR